MANERIGKMGGKDRFKLFGPRTGASASYSTVTPILVYFARKCKQVHKQALRIPVYGLVRLGLHPNIFISNGFYG